MAGEVNLAAPETKDMEKMAVRDLHQGASEVRGGQIGLLRRESRVGHGMFEIDAHSRGKIFQR